MTFKSETIPSSRGAGQPLPTAVLSPPRRPRSIRRTVSVDMQRPDGLDGIVVLQGLGRDLYTAADATVTELEAARFEMTLEINGRIRAAASGARALGELVGESSWTGFRGLLLRKGAADCQPGTLLYQLLDDVPVAAMITGYMDARAGRRSVRRAATAPDWINVCAGWIEGGASHRRIAGGEAGFIIAGPVATPLADGSDAYAWHAQPRLPDGAMRRRRRIDLRRSGTAIVVDSILRDVFIEPGDVETLVHEYAIETLVDAQTLRVTASSARHGSLPTVDCPAGTASAARLAGLDCTDLREAVRRGFRGPTTCTHLNDSLRALADIAVLARRLDDLENSA
ncbi:MAG: DUF2889 domain-containing protein [Gammaproteobacteria bacterium]